MMTVVSWRRSKVGSIRPISEYPVAYPHNGSVLINSINDTNWFPRNLIITINPHDSSTKVTDQWNPLKQNCYKIFVQL